jgi:hypothetical protein
MTDGWRDQMPKRLSQLPSKRRRTVIVCSLFSLVGIVNILTSIHKYPRDKRLANQFDASPSCVAPFLSTQDSVAIHSESYDNLCQSKPMRVLRVWSTGYRFPTQHVELRDVGGQDHEILSANLSDRNEWNGMHPGDTVEVQLFADQPTRIIHENSSFETSLNPDVIRDGDVATWWASSGLLIGCFGIILWQFHKSESVEDPQELHAER